MNQTCDPPGARTPMQRGSPSRWYWLHPGFGALGQCARPSALAILAIMARPSGFPTPADRGSVPMEAS